MTAMDNNIKDSNVQQACCKLLARLAQTREFDVSARSGGSEGDVFCVWGGAGRREPALPPQQSTPHAVTVAIRLVIWASPAVPACLGMIAAGALQKVVKAMRTHQRHVDTQLYACWALVEICGGDAGW